MYTLSNEDRKRLLALQDLLKGVRTSNLRDENRLRLARQALRRLERKQQNADVKIQQPAILDACCGGKMFYFDKDDKRVLFQDIREIETVLCDGRHFSVKPDVVADFTDMPYPDNSYRLVVFDPPHLKYTGSQKEASGWQMTKYGALPMKGWQEYLRKGFAECFRVLEYGGFLIFKWNETDIALSRILELTTYKPILGHRSGKTNKTHWVLFMKTYERDN